MTNLVNLDLNQCPMTTNHEGLTGGIPTEIKTVPLKLIDLGCNKLSGKIPQEMFNITESWKDYKYINLNDNNFNGKIPNGLQNMRRLTQLSLARNQFTGNLPSTQRMLDLILLDLQQNRISNSCTGNAADLGFTGPLPDILFTEGSKLQIVSLNNNCFSGNITGQIRHLTSLRYLDLRNNNLAGKIPKQIKHIDNLKVLLLGGNPQLDMINIPNGLKRFLSDNDVMIDFDLGKICPKGSGGVC